MLEAGTESRVEESSRVPLAGKAHDRGRGGPGTQFDPKAKCILRKMTGKIECVELLA